MLQEWRFSNVRRGSLLLGFAHCGALLMVLLPCCPHSTSAPQAPPCAAPPAAGQGPPSSSRCASHTPSHPRAPFTPCPPLLTPSSFHCPPPSPRLMLLPIPELLSHSLPPSLHSYSSLSPSSSLSLPPPLLSSHSSPSPSSSLPPSSPHASPHP